MTQKTYEFQTGQLSTQIAIGSFLIGTVLLILYQVAPDKDIVIVCGIFYVLLAIFTNGAVLMNLLHHFVFMHNHRTYFGIKILIVLANIPIALFYFLLVTNGINF